VSEHNIYKDALEKWGIELQLDMMIEECAEVIQAITHLKRGGDMGQLIEELADLTIMLRQMKEICGHKRIGLAIENKLERFQRRLKRSEEKSGIGKREMKK